MVHAHATTYAWAWTTDDSTDAFNVVNAIATTYAVDATSALEAERAINDAKDAMGTRDKVVNAWWPLARSDLFITSIDFS